MQWFKELPRTATVQSQVPVNLVFIIQLSQHPLRFQCQVSGTASDFLWKSDNAVAAFCSIESDVNGNA